MIKAAALLLLCVTGAVGEPKVIQSVKPTEVLLGEPFVLSVTVQHPKGERWELLPPKDPGAFEVLTQKRSRDDSGGVSTTTFAVELSAFELGSLTLPKLSLEGQEGGEVRNVPLASEVIQVKGTLPPDADDKGAGLYDIKPPVDVPVATYRLLYALAAVLAVLLGAYFLVRYLRREKPVAAVPAAPPQSLDVRTRAALDALRQEDLPGKSQIREYYFRLSEIVRGYLGERFDFDALECTSSELVSRTKGLPAQLMPQAELEQFILDSDLAKYAKFPIDLTTCQRSMEFGYRLVEQTFVTAKPAPAGPPAAPPRAGGALS